MKKIKKKLEESLTLKALRKKLFIAAAYLIVVASLFGYVSYAQYRIRIYGDVNMPTAATFEASIILFPCETETKDEPEDPTEMGGINWRQVLLADLGPGDSVTESVKNSVKKRRMKVTARNYYTTGSGEDAETVVAQVPVEFSFRIDGTGFLPLEFVLMEENGTTQYNSSVTVNEKDGSRRYIFVDGAGKEATFTVDGDEDKNGEWIQAEKKFYIYVGWQSPDPEEDLYYDDSDYRKEVERLKVGAVTVGADKGHEILQEQELKAELENHKPAEDTTSGGGE